MTQHSLQRLLIILAGGMGAIGVILAASSAHLPDASRLASASSMLLFHAAAILGAVALTARDIVSPKIGLTAGFGFVIATALFSGDLTLRQFLSHGLFPMAAPTGGTLLILAWITVAISAAWPRKPV